MIQNTTFNYLKNSIQQYCENDREIQEFTIDSDYKIDTKYTRQYPIVILSPKSAIIRGTEQRITFYLMIGDNLFEDETNLWDVWNKTFEIGRRISNWFETVYSSYSDAGFDIRIDDKKGVNFKYVKHSMDRELAGVMAEIEFVGANFIDNCFGDVPVNTYNK
jgi:hypothetical protein